MKHKILLFLTILFWACTNDTNSNNNKSIDNASSVNNKSETLQMATLLKELNDTGNPVDHYHWNRKLAILYQGEISKAAPQNKMSLWFKFCTQLLNAGENLSCIDEIQGFIAANQTSIEQLATKETLPILELLALAYLRLGEVQNCQKNHNEFSCIIPIKNEAFHSETMGSKNAIRIYAELYKKFPKDEYKWLLNLAHMTLGEHPAKVPTNYLIEYPNFKKEKSDFPAFKEIAMHINVAHNGLSGGVCLEDFNNDNLIDIFTTSYGMSDQCKIFLNNGSGFTDATNNSGLEGIVSGLNCIHADYDNDGDSDIFVLRGGWLEKGGNHPNSLLRNNGDGTFSDVTKSAGLLSFHPTQTAAWADVNGDGFLDLFIGNETKTNEQHPCELYINQKDGKFKEQAADYNLGSITGFVKGVVFGDINNDKWPDLYISMLGSENLLFKNESGKFKNISSSAGVQNPIFSFPCWFWDVNNDGYSDIFVNSYDTRNLENISDDFSKELQGKTVRTEKSRLFINNGDETFRDESEKYNLDISMYTMGCNFGDLDNDGWLDFYIGTGAPNYNSVIPNRMFKNNNGTKFEEVTSAGRFGHIQKGHGIGFADFDNDGDQDIYAVMGGAYEGDQFTNVCYENPISTNNWIVLHLRGVASNRSAIGTSIKLELDNGRQIFHTVNTGGSFGSGSLQAEIGLGNSESISTLTVTWPNSEAQTFQNISVNKKYQIIEGQNELILQDYIKFKMESNGGGHHHHEHH